MRDADLIAAEDTRRTRKLLSAFDIHTPLVAYHRDNESSARERLLVELRSGKTVALVSDAGTPGIADPGEALVAACVAEDIAVEARPGASSVLYALAVSGLPTGRFVFESFLPRKGRARSDRLCALRTEQRTIVVFEAPSRVPPTLADLASELGSDRSCAVCRELTKIHEETWRGTLGDAADEFEATKQDLRGEFVLVVAGAPAERGEPDPAAIRAFVEARLAGGDSVRDASAAAADALGVPKRAAYEAALGIKAGDD